MTSREEALSRLALDPIHHTLLRQLSEGWDKRQVVTAQHVVMPHMIAEMRFPASIAEHEANRALDESLAENGKAGQIVVFRDIRWFRDIHPYAGGDENHEPPESAAFANHDTLLRWARQADTREIAVCRARALLVPPLPADEFLARCPDGSFERRAGVAH